MDRAKVREAIRISNIGMGQERLLTGNVPTDLFQQLQKFFYGKICIPDDDPQGSPRNFRMTGYRKRTPYRMPEMDMTPFLIADRVAQPAQDLHDILTGKYRELFRHISTAT